MQNDTNLQGPSGKTRSRATLRFVGSYQLAILLMAILALVLAWATFAEWSYFGTAAMRFGVYDAGWFHVLLGLVGLNVLAAALARLPWSRREIPFLVSHLGVLVLLLGCLVTLRYGVEATLPIYEGHKGHIAVVGGASHLDMAMTKSPHATNEAQGPKQAEATEAASDSSDAPRRPTTKRHRMALAPGPFDWSSYRNTAWLPGVAAAGDPQRLSWFPWLLVRRDEGKIFDADGLRVEAIDYLADAEIAPPPPLVLKVRCVPSPADRPDAPTAEDDDRAEVDASEEDGSSSHDTATPAPEWRRVQLTIGQAGHGSMAPSAQQLLPDGTRLFYWVAADRRQTDAFSACVPEGSLGTWGQVALAVDGVVHRLSIDTLAEKVTEIEPKLRRLRWQRAQQAVAADARDADDARSVEAGTRDAESDPGRGASEADDSEADGEAHSDDPNNTADDATTATDATTADDPQAILARLDDEIARLERASRTPLGETPWSVRLERFMPNIPAVFLEVYRDDQLVGPVHLFANVPSANREIPEESVFGAYWVDGPAMAESAGGMIPAAIEDRLLESRIDLLQGSDGRLHIRAWRDGRIHKLGLVPADGAGIKAFPGADRPVTLGVESYTANDCPLGILRALPFPKGGTKPDRTARVPWIRLRVTLDNRQETFWLRKRFDSLIPMRPDAQRQRREPPTAIEHRRVVGRGRSVDIQWRDDEIYLGFGLYVRRFQQKLDPGTSKPAAFSSRVDLLEPDGATLEEDITITLNHPPLFTDPESGRPYRVYQSSFRGPVKPGEPIYEELIGGRVLQGETSPRDVLYQSVFTANYDPGRGLKYLGCLMMVLGAAALFYREKGPRPGVSAPDGENESRDSAAAEPAQGARRKRRGKSAIGGMILITLLWLPAATEAQTDRASTTSNDALDWSDWSEMPVWHQGRIMPLESYAERTVRAICGEERPFLRIDAQERTRLTPRQREAVDRVVGQDGRRFTAPELLLSWLVEPDVWTLIPFLPAEGEQFRESALDLPTTGAAGRRLTRVSPDALARSDRFMTAWTAAAGASARRGSASDPAARARHEKTLKLVERYQLFRRVALPPQQQSPDGVLSKLAAARLSLSLVDRTWNRWEMEQLAAAIPELEIAPETTGDIESIVARLSALQNRYQEFGEAGYPIVEETDAELDGLRAAAAELATRLEAARDTAFSAESMPSVPEESLPRLRAALQTLAFRARALTIDLEQARLALYDNGDALLVVPALNPAALTTYREPKDRTQPWLSLQTLVWGSDGVVRRFARPDLPRHGPTAAPGASLEAQAREGNRNRPIREAFLEAAAAYVDREADGRAEEFNAAIGRLVREIRALGEGLEEDRRAMEIPGRDEAILDQTAYPVSEGRLRAEVFDNRADPFFWSWVVPLVAMLCFLAATAPWPALRKPLYWTGIVVLALTLAVATLGFGLRAYITGWAPVTNMFETMMFVAWVVVVIGLAFCLQPLTGAGFAMAWRRSRLLPQTDDRNDDEGNLIVWPVAAVRGVLTLLGLLGGLWICYAPGDAELVQRATPAWTTLNGLIDALVVGSLLAVIAWWLARLAVAACIAVGTTPRAIRSQGVRSVTLLYVLIAIATSALALFSSWAAYYGPEFEREIKPLMAVLRDNFWLTLHVVTIAIGYAAGVLSFGLAAISLGFYIGGRYRPSKAAAPKSETADTATVALAPETCDALARYILTTMQVAIVFIMIGTITGARWADYSWGRFWSWDPKEVWALITTLVYLIVLHAYRARYIRHFGLAAGAVLGATAIVMTWYGINYVFSSGRHAYGGGTASWGTYVMYGLVALNIVWPTIAGIVYAIRSRRATQR